MALHLMVDVLVCDWCPERIYQDSFDGSRGVVIIQRALDAGWTLIAGCWICPACAANNPSWTDQKKQESL